MTKLSERFIQARQRIMREEFASLNDPQREAVFTTEGPLLILAGAGSGKTTVLINRAASLLKYGQAYFSDVLPFGVSESDIAFLEGFDAAVATDEEKSRAVELLRVEPPHPWQIMAITFTNKAAGELKQRLSDMLGDEGSGIWAMTFHASCARMLRRDADVLGYTSRFVIYDTDDQKRMIKAVMRDLSIDDRNLPEKAVINEISHAKDSMIGFEEFTRSAAADFRMEQIARIYTEYQRRLCAADAMDFDDLLFNTVRLLESSDEVLDYYRRRFRYIMVDEYQDTNKAQYRFIRLLAGERGNLCVVGDDDQSIYKFRGATIENILSFEKQFRNASIIRLEQNYRSTKTILDAANSVISHNTGRHAKKLWTEGEVGDKIVVFNADGERDEAEFIAARIGEWVTGGGRYSDCAVLYRMSALSSVIENQLMRGGIPYRVVAGRKFYDRKEIRDAIAYLSVISNPADDVRLSRIINEPKRGIGDVTFRRAQEIAAGLGLTAFEVLGTADQYAGLSHAAPKLMAFHDMIQELTELSEQPDADLGALLETTLSRTGYTDALLQSDDKAQERIENLEELTSTLIRYQEENEEEATLQDFLEDIALITDIDSYDEDADCVSLMTLHAAKGLEFPVVFIPGAENGIFPGMLTMASPDEVEEDRRLAYVGITRAKKKLFMTHCTYRTLFGHSVHNPRSMYIDEIDPSLIDSRGGRKPQPRSTYEERQRKPHTNPDIEQSRRITVGAHAGSGTGFAAGDRVKHRKYGEGTILSAHEMGSDTMLEIEFDVETEGKTIRKLMANFAGLKKL